MWRSSFESTKRKAKGLRLKAESQRGKWQIENYIGAKKYLQIRHQNRLNELMTKFTTLLSANHR